MFTNTLKCQFLGDGWGRILRGAHQSTKTNAQLPQHMVSMSLSKLEVHRLSKAIGRLTTILVGSTSQGQIKESVSVKMAEISNPSAGSQDLAAPVLVELSV